MLQMLLINLPGESVRKPEEHCGLAFLKSFLEKNNIPVTILDSYARRQNLAQCIKQIKYWIVNCGQCAAFIGISPYVTSYENFAIVGETIRNFKRDIRIFAGGHFASLNREYLLRKHPWLDAIIVGEGELALLEYVKNPEGPVDGVFQRGQEANFKFGKRIIDLDILPFQSRYLKPEELDGQPFAITSSRGCYGACGFCSISSFYRLNEPGEIKQTFRSAANLACEIKELASKYGISHLKIVDDNFFRGRDDSFLEELYKLLNGINISFRLSARPNDINAKRAALLKKIGASVVAIGVESANEQSLDFFNKGLNPGHSEEAIKFLKEQSITCLANFIMFDPIIDLRGIAKNLGFVRKHQKDCIFHRINSHLWIRSTDPLLEKLKQIGLSSSVGFPYVKCRYLYPEVMNLRKYFDQWCNNGMKEYYKCADILMAGRVKKDVLAKYQRLIEQDTEVLEKMLELQACGKLNDDSAKNIISSAR